MSIIISQNLRYVHKKKNISISNILAKTELVTQFLEAQYSLDTSLSALFMAWSLKNEERLFDGELVENVK